LAHLRVLVGGVVVEDDVYDLDQLLASKIKRLCKLALHNELGTLKAVIDIHEAARLLAVAPYFDFVSTGQLGLNNFSADCCGSLLATSVVGAVRAIYIMVTYDSCLEPTIFGKMPAHPLAGPHLAADLSDGGASSRLLRGKDDLLIAEFRSFHRIRLRGAGQLSIE